MSHFVCSMLVSLVLLFVCSCCHACVYVSVGSSVTFNIFGCVFIFMNSVQVVLPGLSMRLLSFFHVDNANYCIFYYPYTSLICLYIII